MTKRQWADKYGSRWYLHRDGTPPHDDDNAYVWRNGMWQVDFEYEDEEDADEFEEWQAREQQKIALKNEF